MAAHHYTDLGFNEPDFPEFDSTPYGGGYDITTTYGKPLPPSTTICYPKNISHLQQSPDHTTIQENGFTPPPILSNGGSFNTPIDLNQRENGHIPYIPPPPLSNDYDYDFDYGSGGSLPPEVENGYYGAQVPLPPSEYVEPCASFLGYWPCLLKDYKKNAAQQQCCSQQAYADEWKKTEEYFFGNSHPYGERSGDGVPQYGYNKHYVEEPMYVQEEYNPEVFSSQLNFNHGYDGHYVEPISYVQEDSNLELSSQKLNSGVDFDYGYGRSYIAHPCYVQDDPPLQYQDLSSQVDFNYGYEKPYMEQPSYVQDDYSLQTWSQRLSYSYCESYEEP